MSLWKVVATDNYGMSGEPVGKDEWFALNANVNEVTAQIVANALNTEEGSDSWHFKACPWDYKLQRFEP